MQRGEESSVDVSIIVPAYHAESTLNDCLVSLLAQEFAGRVEVVVVVSGLKTTMELQVPEDERLQIHGVIGRRLSASRARNEAAKRASGRLFVFTDADVIAPPDWLRRLVDASDNGRLSVAGSVLNGTPRSAAGTVEFLAEFLDCHPRRPARTAWHGATCNLLVPRATWELYGPFPEDLDGGEDTLLTVQLRRDGLFCFAGGASVIHRNRTRWVDVLRHQYEFGRFTARIGRRAVYYKGQFLVRHTYLAPLAAVGRVVSIYARVLAWDQQNLLSDLMLAPGVVAVMAAWGIGLFLEGIHQDRLLATSQARRRTRASK